MSAVEIAELRLVVRHRIRIRHGGTGRPFDDVRARLLDPAWPHWLLRLRGADVVLAAEERFASDLPATTDVEVAVDDPRLLERFQNGGVVTKTLRRGLDGDVEVTLDPVPVSLEAAVVDRGSAPKTGRTVEARGNGTVVALPETSPGVYRSAATTWNPQQQPFRIFVDNQQRGQAALDYTRPITRIRIIDP
jgi:hypothetical protein